MSGLKVNMGLKKHTWQKNRNKQSKNKSVIRKIRLKKNKYITSFIFLIRFITIDRNN